jgi:integrase
VDEKIRSQGESVVDLFQRFTDYKAKDMDARTVEKYRALLARLRPFFKDQRVDFVGVEKAKDFVEYLKDYQKPRTIRDRLATLLECWQWSHQDLDPWKLVKVKDDLKQKPKPFTLSKKLPTSLKFTASPSYAMPPKPSAKSLSTFKTGALQCCPSPPISSTGPKALEL